MKLQNAREIWQAEEKHAFQGWDFSHLDGRWEGEDIPWDYKIVLQTYLKSTDKLLDMGTGGGEFLLSLGHPYELTSVTEAYPPNVLLCKEKLAPLGITVEQVFDDAILPFENDGFDMIINRHEAFDAREIGRILKGGGHFVTQQVGGKNDMDLAMRLIDGLEPPFPQHTLENNVAALRAEHFEILRAEEVFTPIRFFDVGALVYFCKIIEWEFPGFSVEKYYDKLVRCQEEIEEKGYIEGTEHRFVIVAQQQSEKKLMRETFFPT